MATKECVRCFPIVAYEAARDQGVEQGKAIGRVQLLESLVGLSESTAEQLRSKSLEELAAMEDGLKRQLRSRG